MSGADRSSLPPAGPIAGAPPVAFRWRLDGADRPPWTAARPLMRAVRAAVMHAGNLFGLEALPDAFHHGAEGGDSAFFLPEDLDGDGRIDPVTPAPCTLDAQSALRSAEKRREEAGRERAAWEKRRPLLAVLKRQRERLAEMQRESLEESVIKALEGSTNAVLRHFTIAGLEAAETPVKLERGSDKALQPILQDGRGLAQQSTGQRAQTALAHLLASNALIRHWLPHHVLLLDDVSTALDLTNISAECALLRKFAYTTTARKRQVIIASHHDLLTNRMLELLLPPEGFSMLELRLLDWTIEWGPEWRVSRIKPTRSATDDTRKDLGRKLDDLFEAVGEARPAA